MPPKTLLASSPVMPQEPSLRVAMLIADGLEGRGGIERGASYLTGHFATHGAPVQIQVLRTRFGKTAFMKHLSVPAALARFAWLCAFRRFDIVHVNLAPRGSTWRKGVFAGVARLFGRPLIIHLHGSGYDMFYQGLPDGLQRLVRRIFRGADAVVALSPYWRDVVVDQLQVSSERTVIIANGAPAAKISSRPIEALPTIAFLGALGSRKGVDVLVDALGRLATKGLAFRAVLAGDGDDKADYIKQIAEFGLSESVTFPGWLDAAAVDRLLGEADLLVLPSRAENQPIAILEAMARGLPVVSTRVGAIPEQVTHGESGLIVPPGDPVALADALEALIVSRETRTRMGAAGLRRFNADFSIEASAARFLRLYRDLAA